MSLVSQSTHLSVHPSLQTSRPLLHATISALEYIQSETVLRVKAPSRIPHSRRLGPANGFRFRETPVQFRAGDLHHTEVQTHRRSVHGSLHWYTGPCTDRMPGSYSHALTRLSSV